MPAPNEPEDHEAPLSRADAPSLYEQLLIEQPAIAAALAETANQQDHSDPWAFAGAEVVDAPSDTGRPADG